MADTPILNFAGDPKQELSKANTAFTKAADAYNVVAADVRSLRDSISNLTAKLQTDEFKNSSVRAMALKKQAQAALAGYQSQLQAKLPQLTSLRATAEKARTNVTFWQAQVKARAAAAARATPPKTNSQATAKPTPVAQPSTAAPAAVAPAPVPGKDGQAPDPTVKPTTPTPTVVPKESTTEAVATPALPPEEIVAERADHRIRISAFDRKNGGDAANTSANERLYGPNDPSNILQPLWATDGLMFPYTPTIQISQDTSWQTADLEQTNFDILSYQKTSSSQISLTAKFTVQNQREGRYLLAAIHFLRTVSKAYFGAQDVERFDPPQKQGAATTPEESAAATTTRTTQDGRAGLPPPVLLFSGYGTMMFNDLRVVVKSHSWGYEEGADLIKIDLGDDRTVWLPPLMTLSISLAIQNNTDRMRDRFNLDEFRTGKLLKTRGWF